MAGLESVVAFWTRWGIHFVVLLSFTVQVTLLLLSDIRRRKDWVWLKVIIWSAYMLADTTAIYALGHMSVLCNWSPEHQLMALWAPLLLVHLGGQDNISAYAIEDNRLWLRHLQNFVVQVAAAGYVLYASSILAHPMPSKVSWATMLMFVVGVLKYVERIWALIRADSCCSSSLSATSYDKARSVATAAGDGSNLALMATAAAGDGSNLEIRATINKRSRHLILAYSLLDVPKQMFERSTTYVQISSNILNNKKVYEEDYMLDVVEMQVWMMYDLLYTKAAVVHTWYGLCTRVISLPFTVAALALFRSHSNDKDVAAYIRVDVTVSNVLLIGAVILEMMSVLRAIFSKWTAVLLYGKKRDTIGNVVFSVQLGVSKAMGLVGSGALCLIKLICGIFCPSCIKGGTFDDPLLEARMRQHSLFVLMRHHDDKWSVGRNMAKSMGAEDWWDSNVYSSSTEVPGLVITKVRKLVSPTTIEEIMNKSWGQIAVRTYLNNDQLQLIWSQPEMKLEDRILVWHIATHVYYNWFCFNNRTWPEQEGEAAEAVANYMFFLLSARPYMMPYPVSRQAYAQLCTDAQTHLSNLTELGRAVLNNKEPLMQGSALFQPDQRQQTDGAAAQTSILNTGCQLAAKLIHITAKQTKTVNAVSMILQARGTIAKQAESTVTGEDNTNEQDAKLSARDVLKMVLEVWVEMLCYTAYLCNENSHAKHLTDGGEIITYVALMMVYKKNGLFPKNTSAPAADIESAGGI